MWETTNDAKNVQPIQRKGYRATGEQWTRADHECHRQNCTKNGKPKEASVLNIQFRFSMWKRTLTHGKDIFKWINKKFRNKITLCGMDLSRNKTQNIF